MILGSSAKMVSVMERALSVYSAFSAEERVCHALWAAS